MRHRSLVLLAMLLAGGALFAPGASGARQLPAMGKHVCTLIGGVWMGKSSTCEISSSRTVSLSFELKGGQTLLVDKGVTLNISAVTQILDVAGAQFGVVNNGTVNNVGTIANDGTADGALVNGSTGTFNNSGSVAFGAPNDGQVTNQGTLNNSGSLQSWNLTDGGTLSNTANLTVDRNLLVGAGGLLANSGSISAQWSTSIGRGGSIANAAGGTFISLKSSGTSFDNHGSLANGGSFVNYGAFVNEADGSLVNSSGANLGNYDSIDNLGAVTNGGAINDWCGATFTNEAGSSYSGNAVSAASC